MLPVFKVTEGLRRGCSISPTLFKIYLEKGLKAGKKKYNGMGVPLDDNTIYTLSFAGDQVLVAKDYEGIEYMNRNLNDEYITWELEINFNKTQYLYTETKEEYDLTYETGKIISRCQ